MLSLTDASGNAAMLERLETLRADSRAHWGEMTCAQMLAHCQKPFLLARCDLQMKRGLVGKLFGGWAKKKFIDGDGPFGKNSPTDPLFRVTGEQDFAREHAALIAMVERFGVEGATAREPHPFFGPLTAEEWDRLLWKHLDHHLRQFGA